MSRKLRFHKLFSMFMVAAMVLQLFVPLLQRGPGFLKAVSAEESDTPDWEAPADAPMLYDESNTGYAQQIDLPKHADSLDELVPDFLQPLSVFNTTDPLGQIGAVEAVQIGHQGGVARMHNSSVLVMANKGVIDDDVIVYVSTIVERVEAGAGGILSPPSGLPTDGIIQYPSPSAIADMAIDTIDTVETAAETLPESLEPNPDDQYEDPSDNVETEEPQPTEEPPAPEAMPLNDADFPLNTITFPEVESMETLPFVPVAEFALPNIQIEPAPQLAVPPPATATDDVLADVEIVVTEEPPVDDEIVDLSVISFGEEISWIFQLQILDAASGQPISAPNDGLYIAFDLTNQYDALGEIWSFGLTPSVDPSFSIYPDATTHNPTGIISSPLNFDLTSDIWYAQIDVSNVELAQSTQGVSNGGGGVNTPEAWRFEANLPQVSPFTGAAAYNYPIELPPGRAGLMPNIDVTYSSRSLDGILANKQMDQGELGLGWSFNDIAINRTLYSIGDGCATCAKHHDSYSLSLGGASYTLLYDHTIDADLLEYKVLNAPQLRVRLHLDHSAPARDGIFWTVVDADGTLYRLGYTNDAEVGHYSQFENIRHVTDGNPHWWGKENRYSTVKWRVDTITDISGNQIQYDYYDYGGNGIYARQGVHVGANQLSQIRYNYQARTGNPMTRLGGTYATKIHFHAHEVTFHGHNPDNSEDVRYRIVREAEITHLNARFGAVKFIPVLMASNNHLSDRCNTHPPYDEAKNIVIGMKGIQLRDWKGQLAPATTFDYSRLPQLVGDFAKCFHVARLTGVRQPYGGYTRIMYQGDSRSNVNKYGQSYYVTRVENFDGVRGWIKNDGGDSHRRGEYTVTAYGYKNPCYDSDEAVTQSRFGGSAISCFQNKLHSSFPDNDSNKLSGFGEVQIYQYDYAQSNHPLLQKSVTTYYRDGYQSGGSYQGYANLLRFGKPYRERLFNEDNVLHQQKYTGYSTVSPNAKHYFTPVTQECTLDYYHYRANTGAMPYALNCVRYQYAENMQGNAQYGNVTAVQESGDIGGKTRTRTTQRKYFPNNNQWIVNRVAWEALNDGNTLSSFTVNYYDGQDGVYFDLAT